MTEPSRLPYLIKHIVDKSVHTNNGVHIGNIHSIDNDSVVVKGDIVSTVYYHIPIERVREWDGHALWLTMDDKESKKHILLSQSREDSINAQYMQLELDEDTLDQISQAAESHGVSQTSYINQIMKRYLEWHRIEPNANIVTMSRPVLKELFGNLGEEQILSMAKNTAKNALLKTVRLVSDQQRQTQEEKKGNKNLDMNSFLSWLENQMNNYAIELRHIISKEEDKDGWNRHLSNNTRDNDRTSHLRRYHKYVLKHDIGSNYSLYFKTLLESIFNEKLQKHISIKTASSMLTFEFQE
ncbi:MAG TPA: hypothetical protein VJ729_11250 [Nitrososphaeraceae archaeon]|nr:hypothetical protein [Nitrososphaeraceae archaeon]